MQEQGHASPLTSDTDCGNGSLPDYRAPAGVPIHSSACGGEPEHPCPICLTNEGIVCVIDVKATASSTGGMHMMDWPGLAWPLAARCGLIKARLCVSGSKDHERCYPAIDRGRRLLHGVSWRGHRAVRAGLSERDYVKTVHLCFSTRNQPTRNGAVRR